MIKKIANREIIRNDDGEVEEKLKEFQAQIEDIRLKEEEEHDNQEITRDENGNAIIYVKDKNKKNY